MTIITRIRLYLLKRRMDHWAQEVCNMEHMREAAQTMLGQALDRYGEARSEYLILAYEIDPQRERQRLRMAEYHEAADRG